MALIAPLKPLRYAAADEMADLVAPPYDVIYAPEKERLLARSPHNVVRLELPEGEGDAKYENAARLLSAWTNEKVVTRDEEPGFYVYEQTFEPPGGGARRTRRGFLALVRVVPFSARVVLPHERTLSGPKEDRLKLVRATRTNVSPGFMLYRDPGRVLDRHLSSGKEVSSFTTAEGIAHRLSKVFDPAAVKSIVDHIATTNLLIADGHHRYETALRYSEEVDAALVAAGKKPNERGEHHFFMVFLCNEDDPNLVVFPTHRLVRGLATFDFEKLLADAAPLFEVTRETGELDAALERLRATPAGRTQFLAVAKGGKLARLSLKAGADLGAHQVLSALPAIVRRTDVAVLHGGILEPLLGIDAKAQAAQTNLSYVQNPRDAVAKLDSGEAQVLFVMNATPVPQVRAVCEEGEVMPQKSTYFYPKVLTGLALHTLDPERTV
jgi:uncharacterized protein (DUF1015 family)